VLPDTAVELACTVAERIRDKIGRHHFSGGRNLKLSLTASFGVAAFPAHASSPQQLIACADTAMYEAKAANKNCIRFSAASGHGAKIPREVSPNSDIVETSDEKPFS
jgi:diguanylate cyclase (GGDEF)-like protein